MTLVIFIETSNLLVPSSFMIPSTPLSPFSYPHDFFLLLQSNFAMGLAPAKRHNCYLIDFGLARRYILPQGEVRPVSLKKEGSIPLIIVFASLITLLQAPRIDWF